VQKVNTNDLAELTWSSPKGKFVGAGKQVSEALGRKPASTDLNERHPFDVEISRIPAGKLAFPYHSHSAQWEFYHVISGTGIVKHKDGSTPIEAGDAFIFKPMSHIS
jgi:mannose-6-phosphate isomerase-like protein (cupin superfamily)